MGIPEHVRGWLYRVAIAAMPLLILYGVFSEAEAAVWLGVVAAVLAVAESGLAAAHTSIERQEHP